MSGDAIRYHFPDEVKLDVCEPIFLEEFQIGAPEFAQRETAPNNVRDMASIRALVRSTALARGGEAWRATTERGEVLCCYSVTDLAKELGANTIITMLPHDQLCLAVARWRLGVCIPQS
jgi:hypothetical protein